MGGSAFEPPLGKVLSALTSLDFVGIVEFFHESACLLKLRADVDATDTSAHCTCDDGGATEHPHVTHHAHGHETFEAVVGRRAAAEQVEAVEAAERLTSLDYVLYEHALRRFFADVRRVEARRGVRFLCDRRLAALQSTLGYVSTDLRALYEQAAPSLPER